MLVVNDSMVLIHLAKISLLEKACDFFGKAVIPELVFEETAVIGKQKGFDDSIVIENVVKKGKLVVMRVKAKEIEQANKFNVFSGEAHALALYWQEKADLMATDDNSVRNKKEILEVNVIGTPAILLALYNNKIIDSEKSKLAILKLRKIGWFNSEVLDRITLEVEKNESIASNWNTP